MIEKNYITRQGYEKLKAELLDLIQNQRLKTVEIVSWAAGNGDRSENGDYIYGKKKLREIDKRIYFLTKRLEVAQVVDSSLHFGSQQIFFGATVTYADETGLQRTIKIVGIDEIDAKQNYISWISPIAKVLLKSNVGDEVIFKSPQGEKLLEIIKVNYQKN